MKLTFKALGFVTIVECEGGTCSSAIEAFERVTQKSLSNMDLFVNGSKIQDLNTELEDGSEVTAIKSKHESAY